ncbi:uncharacterized protein BO80DRAFT_258590 [Aspergillus ibericus CBS 121593]|uniref:Gamma-glutamylcyclotransferase AIG2-like domain-containing protein n=1 Tax=Aspergillus ibericus CBS 121593 TaxID=1448316 RepID=A0A395H969_9EURO|nr:hypothetical protein BO80DRAFT_258590 [Aspergillus ibericus CBS 121593]RAL04220.1 hypothetical protein BO80DRAFT_258590 [Aspergillus ibericus CBS 121593]
METKPTYPRNFQLALSNKLSPEDVTNHLNKPGCTPRFVYGVLMLPTVLSHYLDTPQTEIIAKQMTRATLRGHKLYRIGPDSTPVMVPSSDPQDTVEGMLIFGLDAVQRNAIYEKESGLMELVNVRVTITQVDGLLQRHVVLSQRVVDAGAFVWVDSQEGLIPMERNAWPVDEFLGSQFYENICLSRRTSLGEWKERFVENLLGDSL